MSLYHKMLVIKEKRGRMKNILILASGSVAKSFLEWISLNRVAENHYYVTCHKANTLPDKIIQNITHLDIDPTSFSKLKHIMDNIKFVSIFVVLEDYEDAKYVLKNIALIKTKIRIVLVNQWAERELEEQENLTIIQPNKLIASHLYEQLPNVPLVAQNIGLGRGEIMQVHVPFGSAYAYRHIGSILQRKWKIVAVYRKDKQILPTTATMIRPNDMLLIVGKPIVLAGVYKTINKRIGLFPEPFGKNIYLIIDFRYDQNKALAYLRESIYLMEKLKDKSLYIRILYPNNFDLIRKLKDFESDNISLAICYKNINMNDLIEYDIHEHNIGLIMNSIQSFEADGLKDMLFELKKLVFLFGDTSLYDIDKSIVLMENRDKMESISSTAFDISESFGLSFTLADFDPEGFFEENKMIIEHYETMAQIFGIELHLEEKIANPIRELRQRSAILQVSPFEKDLNTNNFKKLISSKISDFILTTHKHPKLLVPFALGEE